MTQGVYSGSLQLRLWLMRFGLVNTMVVLALVAGTAAWLVPEADGLRLSRLGVIPAASLAQRAGRSAPAADLDQPGLALAATGMRA